jgi:fatty acid desaturase
MLAEAARFARLIGAATDRDYLRRRAKAAMVTSTAWVVAGVLALVAAIFGLIAAFAALAEVMPVWAAALVVAAIAVIMAGIAVLVATRSGRKEPLPHYQAEEAFAVDPGAAAAATMSPLIDEAFAATREKPGESILLAVAAGMIVGRWLRRPRR